MKISIKDYSKGRKVSWESNSSFFKFEVYDKEEIKSLQFSSREIIESDRKDILNKLSVFLEENIFSNEEIEKTLALSEYSISNVLNLNFLEDNIG